MKTDKINKLMTGTDALLISTWLATEVKQQANKQNYLEHHVLVGSGSVIKFAQFQPRNSAELQAPLNAPGWKFGQRVVIINPAIRASGGYLNASCVGVETVEQI